MKRIMLILALGMMIAGFTGCPKDDGDIVVIIEDPTYNHDGNGDERPPRDTTDEPRPPRDMTEKPPRIEAREMSLSAALTLLKRDVERGDLTRLKRHTDALEQAVSAQYEQSKSSSRKRTLNLISAKLRGVKKILEGIEKDEMPESVRLELEVEIGEISSLAERLER